MCSALHRRLGTGRSVHPDRVVCVFDLLPEIYGRGIYLTDFLTFAVEYLLYAHEYFSAGARQDQRTILYEHAYLRFSDHFHDSRRHLLRTHRPRRCADHDPLSLWPPDLSLLPAFSANRRCVSGISNDRRGVSPKRRASVSDWRTRLSEIPTRRPCRDFPLRAL